MTTDHPQPRTRAALLADGHSDRTIRAGHARLRYGAYLEGTVELPGEARCRATIAATAPMLAARSVLSHQSAALWRGLPLVGVLPTKVHVLRGAGDGGFRRGHVHSHVGHVEPGEIELVDGLPVTSVARTVLDCARTLPPATGLVLAAAALHASLVTPDELVDQLDRARRRRGIGRARMVVAFADARSESPGESLSRLRIREHRLPAPELQYEVCRPSGRVVARSDFGWEAARTVGEFDGEVKYGRLLRPGETAGDAIHREKVREDLVRDLEHEMVRWGWRETTSTEAFTPVAASLRRAFARGRTSGRLTPGERD